MTNKYLPPDGISRTPEAEYKINNAFSTIFNGKAGEAVLNYLKSITVNHVHGAGIDPNALLHYEGQRHIIGLIQTRITHGKNHEPQMESNNARSSRGVSRIK